MQLTPKQETRRRMALIWGVLPLESRDQHRIDTLAEMTEKKLLHRAACAQGDVIGINRRDTYGSARDDELHEIPRHRGWIGKFHGRFLIHPASGRDGGSPFLFVYVNLKALADCAVFPIRNFVAQAVEIGIAAEMR